MKAKSQSVKQKTCKICKMKFTPIHPLQSICTENDFQCAKIKSVSDRLKKAAKEATTKRIETRKAKEAIKTRAQWMKEAQQAFNAFIRARDKKLGYGCISCGSMSGKENCGHYRSVGSSPELRFNELNCHLQCEKCNTYLHGNLINYRIALLGRIGLDKLEWIESKHEANHYSIDDLKEIKKIYKAKINIQGNKE